MAAYEREIPFLDIPEHESIIHGLSAVWGRGNQLLLHTGCGQRRKAKGSGDQVVHHQMPSRFHQVEWQTDMHNPHTRKLVMQSHDVFVSLQKHSPQEKDTSRKPQLIKCSRHYRAFIAECVQDLRKASMDPNIDRTEAKEYGDQCEIFQTIGLIWSLCEILFVETLPGGIVLQQLLDWVKLHFTEGDVKARNVLMAEEIKTTDEYWSAIYIYVLQGRLTEARHMLSLDPKFQQDTHGAYGKIDELMRRMPVFGTLSRQSLAEFDLKWRHWQDMCRQCLEDHSFASYPRLEVICKILCGDQSVLLQEVGDLIQDLGGWYHLMVTRLLYTNPTVKALDLQYHATASRDACGVSGRMSSLDSILEKALEFDIYQMIKISSATLSNWWFVAHLADLLHHCGQLDSHQLNFGSDLREFLLLEYASTLMSHNSFWQVVADYLDHCPHFGRHYLELFIERIPLKTERKAFKVLKACEDRDMKEQAQSICKVLGMRCYRQGRLGSALTWCLRSHDPTFATYLADKFLTEYSLKGGFTNIDLLDNLGAGMLLSDRLTFLGKYREFHRLYEQGDFSDAAALLLSLLRARLAPKQFWLTLLTDALPLLELDELVFSSKQTYELLRCHEELERWFQSEEYKTQILPKKSKGQLELEKEKLELLQLGLSRNIAQALLQEGCTSLQRS